MTVSRIDRRKKRHKRVIDKAKQKNTVLILKRRCSNVLVLFLLESFFSSHGKQIELNWWTN